MQFFLANLFSERLAGLDEQSSAPEQAGGESRETTALEDRLTRTAA